MPSVLKSNGPLLLASNHPNSFLDGIILTTLFDQPVFSLARGDAFSHIRIGQFLRRLQLLPVYRTSEGIHNLGHNYSTFDACQRTFENNGIVLIFSEGRCENEWHLRPLKKGTARLAVTSWKRKIPLKVIPVGINYSSFHRFGKEVHINFGIPIDGSAILERDSIPRQLLAFNDALSEQLQQLVYEIDPEDKNKVRSIFSIGLKKNIYLLLIPALIGWILHAPVFYPCKLFSEWKFRNSGHYDSVLTSLLILTYPFYVIIIVFLFFFLLHLYSLFIIPLMILTAISLVEVKYQADI